jgi:site-specific recombinase XerD
VKKARQIASDGPFLLMTFEKSIELYIRSRSSRLSARTVSTYQSVLKLFCAWLKNPDLSTINDDILDDYLVHLKEIYQERTRCLHANAIRAFLKHWSAKGEITVAWEIIQGPRITETFPDFISSEQFDLIDETLDEDDYSQLTRKVVFQLLWNTGMRISELLSLKIADIRADRNYTYITTMKTKKLRMVMWNDECHRLLMKYIGIRICMNKAEHLFQTAPSRRNAGERTRLQQRSVQRWCRELQRFLGFPIRPHAFRHGKCHEILNAGGNRHQVQSIAGHSSITSSEIYVRLNLQEQGSLLQRFLPKSATTEKFAPRVDMSYPFTV